MSTNFKCSCCGHEKVFQREIQGKIYTSILDIRNAAINSHVVFKACENCHVVHAFWYSLEDSPEFSEEDRKKIKEALHNDNVHTNQ